MYHWVVEVSGPVHGASVLALEGPYITKANARAIAVTRQREIRRADPGGSRCVGVAAVAHRGEPFGLDAVELVSIDLVADTATGVTYS